MPKDASSFGKGAKAAKPYDRAEPEEAPKLGMQPKSGGVMSLAELKDATLEVVKEFTPYSGKDGGGFIDVAREGGARITFEFMSIKSGEAVRAPFAYKKFKPEDEKVGYGLELAPHALESIESFDTKLKALMLARFDSLFPNKVREFQDEASRKVFISGAFQPRIAFPKKENEGKYAPTLRLANKETQPPTVQMCKLKADKEGNPATTKPIPGSPDDLKAGCMVVPVLELVGGVWVVAGKWGYRLALKEVTVYTNLAPAQKQTQEFGNIVEDSDDEEAAEGVESTVAGDVGFMEPTMP